MRLSEQAREAIRHTVLQDLGPQAELRLLTPSSPIQPIDDVALQQGQLL